jgi:HEPN domain-containing protein
MPERRKTVAVPRAEARLYLGKAEQFLQEARSALERSRHDAALLNAIHAAISGSDAVTAVLAERRSADPEHQRAVDLLEEVAGQSEEIKTRVRQLRMMLLAKKNIVEYESRQGTAKEAVESVERAERFVEWARQVVDRARV